ncbi:MAG TPA: hemerythrin domain-containing protein, partial [Methanomicrobiales archaeon]|nr:hemerythrin domain-containing protein [Methanomicrobiales archaeon]
FYPRLRPEMPDLVNEALREHQEIRTHMQQAMANLSDQQEAMRHIQDLKEAILHHVGEEQDKIFPRVREAFTSEQLEDMAVDFEDAKQRAPSIGAVIPGRAEASR